MKLLLSSLQWVAFILAASIVTPIAIGGAFHLPPDEIASLLQRTVLIIGLSGLLQVLFGHKLPIYEGPAGLWWGVFLVFAALATSGALPLHTALGQLESGMLISGALFVLLGVFGWMERVKKLFTPLVTGTYLILLVAQIGGSIVKGIAGVGYRTAGVDLFVAGPALLVLLLTIVLAKSRNAFLRSYSVLISLAAGWLLFIALGLGKELPAVGAWFSLPVMFEWGWPQFSPGITVTSLFIGLLLLANMIASIQVVEQVMPKEGDTGTESGAAQPEGAHPGPNRLDAEQSEAARAVSSQPPVNYNRTSIWMGINTWLAGLFSAVGCVPVSGTAGFMATTRLFAKLPFIIASFFLMGISFFPPLTSFFATLPMPIGYATLFMPFAGMIGIGLKSYRSLELNDRQLFVIGMALMVGIGSMFIPANAIGSLPDMLKPIVNNGLVLGTVLCIALEQGGRLAERRRNRKSSAS